MTMEKLRPNEFVVKVRRGRLDRPIYMKRRAVMIMDREKKDITLSYDNCFTVLKTKFISRVPWSPPRQGSTLRFMSDIRNCEEMFVEFESHEKLLEAFSILKSKLERSQFVFFDKLQRGRGLHTTNRECNWESEEVPSMVEEPRKGLVRNLIDRFESLSFLTPSSKRPCRSEPTSVVTAEDVEPSPSKKLCERQSPTMQEDVKRSPPRSEGPKEIKNGEQESVYVEYIKKDHGLARFSPAMRKLNGKLFEPTTSQGNTSGFANLGNTCYMNAMLQGLFAMDIFAKDLFKFCKKVQARKLDLENLMPMSLALSSLASIRDKASSRQKRELLTAIKDASRFEGNAQQDANEFLVDVLTQVHDECDKLLREQYGIVDGAERRMQNPVMANFAFTMQSTITCDMCHHASKTDEDSIFLPVTINVLDQASERFSRKFSYFPSVQTLLDEFFKTENIERKCEFCQGKSGRRTQKFVQLPRCLIVVIKRYVYEVSRSVKRNDKIDIPLYLTLDGQCIESPTPFLTIPLSTKKINFASASPVKRKVLKMSANTPSPARRRLILSDEENSCKAGKVNAEEDNLPALSSFNLTNYKTERTDTASQRNTGFVALASSLNLKDEKQVTDDFVTPAISVKNFEKSLSQRNFTSEELSKMTEEEQVTLVCELSLMEKEFKINEDKSDDSIATIDLIETEELGVEAEEDNEAEEPRGQPDDVCDDCEEKLEGKPNQDSELSDEVRNEEMEGSREGVQSMSLLEKKNSNVDHKNVFGIEGFAREIPMEKALGSLFIDVDVEEVKEGDCSKEEQRKVDCADSVTKNPDVMLLSQRRMGAVASDEKKAAKGERRPTSPSVPIPSNSPSHMAEQYQARMSHESSPSTVDSKEILEESGAQIVPYKPMPIEKRRVVCSQMGLSFNYDCIEKTAVRFMGPTDRPSRVAGIVGDGNCLFRALAFYFAGSDAQHLRVRESIVHFEAVNWNEFAALKGWSSEVWNDHMNSLLTDSTWGTEIELFAIAAMLSVDVWTFYERRWICYRPIFKIVNGDVVRVSVNEHRVGRNDGIYLLNEFSHFTPVIEPSNSLLMSGDKRIYDLLVNANEGFMKPSYRLVSVISHVGQTSESGHYTCDIWCKKRKEWLYCNDESVLPITEEGTRSRSDSGYIYFYLNSELFESENA